jgi:ATP-binding cassette subfamily B protein
MVISASIHTINLPWDQQPLNLLNGEQQIQFKRSAQVSRHTIGEILWSTQNPGGQGFIITGEVRLIQEAGKSVLEPGKQVLLKPGDWFGDLLELAGHWRARAASQEVVVAFWPSEDWYGVAFPELQEFWERQRWRYQPYDPKLPHPVIDYPYTFHLDTAAACLMLATEALKTPIPLKQIHLQLRGQAVSDMMEAAEKLGLQLQHVQTDWTRLPQLSLPALLHWHQQHWVFVYETARDRLIIADPMNPRKTCESLPRELVEAAWDGQLWLVSSPPEVEKFNLRWFLPAVWRYRRLFGEVLLTSLTLQVLGLASPLITQVVIDKVIVHGSLSTLDVMAIALLCVSIFEAGLGILRLFTFTHTTRRLDLSLSAQLFRHLLQLPLAYFESRRVGDTIARTQELENIRQFLTGTALTVILDGIFVVVYLLLMLFYSGTLTAVSLVVTPFFVALIWLVTPLLRAWLNESFNRRADSQSFLVEAVSGIHAVKAHTAELPARERWEGLLARYVNQSFRTDTLSNINSHVGDFLTHLSELLILWFGAKLVIQQHLTVGQLVAFQMLSGRAIGPLLRLAQLWQNFQQVLLSVDRIGDILNAKPEADPETGLVLQPLQGRIVFENVVFRYQPYAESPEAESSPHHSLPEPAIQGISFTIEPGMFVGIVGRSGSGKSTVSKLIQRLYEPEKGRILLDGFDIKGANLPSLRKQIGTVLQDDFLFNGTVFDNITFSNSEIPLERVMEAARLAAAHEFISELPHGYQTHIGERGTGLSGGQRQRLALARLFLSDAPILILDEATSALDSETEQRILQNLSKVSRNRTVLMIAHRFASLKHADLILVLEKGDLVEQGRHDDLLQQQGVYWALYQKQGIA